MTGAQGISKREGGLRHCWLERSACKCAAVTKRGKRRSGGSAKGLRNQVASQNAGVYNKYSRGRWKTGGGKEKDKSISRKKKV